MRMSTRMSMVKGTRKTEQEGREQLILMNQRSQRLLDMLSDDLFGIITTECPELGQFVDMELIAEELEATVADMQAVFDRMPK